MILSREQLEAVETLTRELDRTVTNPTHITLTREDATTLSHLLDDLISENHERNAATMPAPEEKSTESAVGPTLVLDEGSMVACHVDGKEIAMTAQTAFDLHQSIGRVLSSCVQPFQPWPREESR